MTSLIALFLIDAAVSAVVFVLLWLLSLKLKDVSFVDAWWGVGMALLGWTAYLQAGPTPHGTLLVWLCTVWALRLGGYLLWRWRKYGADRRYINILNDAKRTRGWGFAKASFLVVFLLQYALQLVVALPVQLGHASPAPLGGLAIAGAVLAVIGILFETIGDAQLAVFKSNRDNAGLVMDTGLWRYTRHPNYFGDACVWWGLYLIAAETGLGAWALPGPILITVLLTKWSGVPLVEERLRRKRKGYEEYVARTSSFVPWFPKKG